MKNKHLNLPNILSLIRVGLVPAFMATLLYMQQIPVWSRLVPMALFAIASFTDFLDGHIARKRGLVTDFGKFIDPLADKFMVFGALIALLVTDVKIAPVLVWVAAIIMLRELAVTSLRMIVANKVVIAADIFGKIKTVSQMVCVIVVLIEPVIFSLIGAECHLIASYITVLFSALMTLLSGINYFKAYWPYINPNK